MSRVQIITTIFISAVWLVNGLFCKVLNLVPRHQEIVANILGPRHSFYFTKAIGFGEILIVIWILGGIKRRSCVCFQILMVACMNIVEFIMVPHLLLFGRFNIVIAGVFIALIYWNEFIFQNEVHSALRDK